MPIRIVFSWSIWFSEKITEREKDVLDKIHLFMCVCVFLLFFLFLFSFWGFRVYGLGGRATSLDHGPCLSVFLFDSVFLWFGFWSFFCFLGWLFSRHRKAFPVVSEVSCFLFCQTAPSKSFLLFNFFVFLPFHNFSFVFCCPEQPLCKNSVALAFFSILASSFSFSFLLFLLCLKRNFPKYPVFKTQVASMFVLLCCFVLFASWFFEHFFFSVQLKGCNKMVSLNNPRFQKCQKLVSFGCPFWPFSSVVSENTIKMVVSEKLRAIFRNKKLTKWRNVCKTYLKNTRKESTYQLVNKLVQIQVHICYQSSSFSILFLVSRCFFVFNHLFAPW